MATLTNLDATAAGFFAATPQTMTAADVLVFEQSKKQLLVLNNATAGSLTVVIDGADGTTVSVAGLGSVSVSGGLSVTLAAGEVKACILTSIRHYLQGVVAVTGGAGIKAQIFNI
jgi:hypothetical protein